MSKYHWMSIFLSLFALAMLPLHGALAAQLGSPEWLNMLFGLPIGLATAFNIDIITRKISVKK